MVATHSGTTLRATRTRFGANISALAVGLALAVVIVAGVGGRDATAQSESTDLLGNGEQTMTFEASGGAIMAEYPDTTARFSTDDIEIEYTERGSGEPIVLVHAGVFGDWFGPASVSSELDGFRVIRIRRAGYGSITPARHLSVADHARHVGALADHLGLSGIHVVGHSSSALMGLQLALDRPDLVRSLVLIEPAPAGGFRSPASADLVQQFIGPAMAAFAAGDLAKAFDTFMQGVCGDGYRTAIGGRLGSAGYDRAIRESAFFFRDEIPAVQEWQFDAVHAARIRQPALVVEGGESARLGPMSRQITDLATSLLPHAEVATVAGVNHAMPLQDPDAVARLIATFVRRHQTE